jgi:hypothetical protein
MLPVLAGKTRVAADVTIIDPRSGTVLYHTEVDGKVVIGPFGGDTMAACDGLAKELVRKLRRRFF